MDRLRILRTLSTSPVHIGLDEALVLADAIHAEFQSKPKGTRTLYDVTTLEGRAAFAQAQPSVMLYVREDKKINAIKELRTIFAATPGLYDYSGLRETKDVVDYIFQSIRYGDR